MNGFFFTLVSKSVRSALCLATLSGPAFAQDAVDVGSMGLGVQTHFAQGWPIQLMAKVGDVGASGFRDGLRWNLIEPAPGHYNFESIAAYMATAARLDHEPLLVFHGTHPAYDDNETPHTDEGRRAFARFVSATISAFPDQIKRIEVGNEINAPNFMSGPYKDDPTGNYAALASVVSEVVKANHPDVEILCTGAHSVALAYFRDLFTAGALDDCDAISLHPYRPQPEGVDRELNELKALMEEYGELRPIYATEFGSWFESPSDAPEFLLKMTTLMSAADIEAAYWYALYDEPWWPNMGLFDKNSREKPAKPTFQFIAKELLPLGRSHLVGEGGVDRIYAFGDDGKGFVAWGAPGAVNVKGSATFYDATGKEIPRVDTLSDTPVVILGEDLEVTVTRDTPIYDSLLQFRHSPRHYLAAADGGPETDLTLQETNWAPYLGNRYLSPLGISDLLANGSLFDGKPMYAIERFVAPSTGRYEVLGKWWPEESPGDTDGADIRISGPDGLVTSGVTTSGLFELSPAVVFLDAGEALDFAIGPNQAPGGDVVRRRITIKGPLP